MVIDAPLQKVFDYVKLIKNQDHFNKWLMMQNEPGMKREFTGTDGTAGFIYAWKSDKKGGEGEKEIKSIVEGKSIESEIRFVKPFKAVARVRMTTEALSETRTKVSWSNDSRLKYPLNIMLLLPMEKMMAKDMAESLGNLKKILEQ